MVPKVFCCVRTQEQATSLQRLHDVVRDDLLSLEAMIKSRIDKFSVGLDPQTFDHAMSQLARICEEGAFKAADLHCALRSPCHKGL